MFAKIKMIVFGGMAIIIAFLASVVSYLRRKSAEDKLKNAKAVIEAEHESDALLQDRLGQEKQEVKNATDNPDIDHFSK